VFYPHDNAIVCLGRDSERGWKACRIGKDRMIATDRHLLGKTGEDQAVVIGTDAGRLAVDRLVQLAKLAAIGNDKRLQAKTYSEDRQVAIAGLTDRGRAIEILRRARSGRQND